MSKIRKYKFSWSKRMSIHKESTRANKRNIRYTREDKVMNKYRNKKVQIDRYVFDSIAEGARYRELALLERAGKIKNLELQPRFLLQEGFKKNGKTYRKIEYIADFKYEENGKIVVEDVKGMQTDVFKLKHKLFEHKYPEYELRIIK